MSQPLIFVSYSHKDEAEKDKLLAHLGVLQSDLIDIWSDDRLGAGVSWEQEISKSISRAKVAILLITANFLTSRFILQKEVLTFLERREQEGIHVFPVIAKACAWRKVKWLSEMNVRPKNGTPVWSDSGAHIDEDLAAIAEEVADIIERVNDSAAPAVAHVELVAPPIAPPVTRNPSERNAEKTAAAASPKILIVDDIAGFREAVAIILRDMNINLFEAGSVKEGIKLLDENQDIRVILLDLNFDEGESGTALLDFIKDRASYYRVIILTAHVNLLAAEQASAYNIFYYLPKAGREAPTQTLRFAVTRALDDLKREETDTFGSNLLRNYPTPFIYIYQQLKSDMTPLEKLISQKDMLELLLHFSAVALLGEYLNSNERNDELDAQIRERIYKPVLGDWFNIINEIVKRRKAVSETFFLDSFLAFFTGRNKKIIGDFISIRNKYVGHGTKHSDYEYEDVVRRCDEWLESLLQDYRFITRYLLCYVLNVQIIKGKFIYSLKECLGSNPQLLNSTKPLGFLMNTNEMHLVSLDTEQSRSLYPFMLLEHCADCRQLEIFLYSKFSNNQLHYLSYKTGHWIVKEDPAVDFLELIKAAQ